MYVWAILCKGQVLTSLLSHRRVHDRSDFEFEGFSRGWTRLCWRNSFSNLAAFNYNGLWLPCFSVSRWDVLQWNYGLLIPPSGLGLYTILLLPRLYGVWHTHGRSGWGRVLPNHRAIVLQQCGQCGRAGRLKGRLIHAQTTKGKTISCAGQIRPCGVIQKRNSEGAYTYTLMFLP